MYKEYFQVKIILALLLILLPVLMTPGRSYSEAGFNPEITAFVHSLEKQAKKDDSSFKGFDEKRGRAIFFEERPNEKIGKISCATCHTSDLKKSGKTTAGKLIEPLAPSVNKKRLASVEELDKWLKRNFKQVYNREGTAREKGDVLTFINSQ
jgi:cytochrome c peroxidase